MFDREIENEIRRVPRENPDIPSAPNSQEDSKSLDEFFRHRRPQDFQSTNFHGGARGGIGHRLVAWSFIAALIDGLIMISTTCFLVFAAGLIARYQMEVVVYTFQQAHWKYLFLAEVILCFFYLTIARSFLGFTIGEWACGLRLGALKQRLHRFYSLRVIARTLITFVTGIVSLPILSLLVGRDLAGWIVGLPLIEHRESLAKKK